jgi:hypothetical protein
MGFVPGLVEAGAAGALQAALQSVRTFEIMKAISFKA